MPKSVILTWRFVAVEEALGVRVGYRLTQLEKFQAAATRVVGEV